MGKEELCFDAVVLTLTGIFNAVLAIKVKISQHAEANVLRMRFRRKAKHFGCILQQMTELIDVCQLLQLPDISKRVPLIERLL